MLVSKESKKIISIAVGKGREHDFSIYKKSKVRVNPQAECIADKGYQGIQKYHKNSQTPTKKRKGRELSKEEKQTNRELAAKRIVVEHVIRRMKIWRIMSERYRNRRKRYGLRVRLILAIYNIEIEMSAMRK